MSFRSRISKMSNLGKIFFWGTSSLLAVVILAGFLVWWFILRTDSPPAPDIDRQVEAVQSLLEGQDEDDEEGDEHQHENLEESLQPASDADGEESPDIQGQVDAMEDEDSQTGAGSGDDSTGIDGIWQINTSVGEFDDYTSTYAGFRIGEELLQGIGNIDAVARTPDVSGELEIRGTQLTSLNITVDLANITSTERNARDRHILSALEVDNYPTATFVLDSPFDFEFPGPSQTVEFAVPGTLTIKNVSRMETANISARLEGEFILISGSFDVALEDYGVENPTASIVASIEDIASVEMQLYFTKS